MSVKTPYQSDDTGLRTWPWIWLSLFMLAISVYFVGRHGGRWSETDSAAFAQYMTRVAAQGRLVSEQQAAYPNGYGFQAISVFILALTGLDVSALQQLVYPLLTALIVVPAWILYRELIGDSRGATFATLLLLMQPEFLFVLLRSSHEKFTRLLLIICLFLLVRSFSLYRRPAALAVAVLLFYLAAFAMIANNNLLANSFFAAIAIALGMGWLLQRRGLLHAPHGDDTMRRLIYVLLICLGLVYIFTFYAYTPAEHNLLIMRDIWERVAALFLDVEHEVNNSYSAIAAGWISLPIYFVLSIANWALLLASVMIWAGQSWRWLYLGEAPKNHSERILWLLYTAFAIQGAVSVVVDASGSLAGNMQHRIFPSFSLLAVAMVGAAMVQWQSRYGGKLAWLVVLALSMMTVLSALKASNEPLFSNKWMFYRQEEMAAINWSDNHLQYSSIWTEFDERLAAAYITTENVSLNKNTIKAFNVTPTMRVFLVSEVSRLRSRRIGVSLPVPYDALRVYDNGLAEIYRLRPETPVQK